ncbi:PulJ/GspJ family protein [Hydrogenophaga defluvii]|uniref:Type II secretion system protein J n=1 Tax=Hydrogenophaga defluvii TaxID=249410 RepID=A0ABW2S8S8_9BURK
MTRRQQHGFTLVEVVIAVGLTSLILAALGSALHGISQGFARATEQAQRQDRVQRTTQALRGSLGRITGARFARAPQTLAEGSANQLTWLAPLPDSAPVAGLYRWQLRALDNKLELAFEDPQLNAPGTPGAAPAPAVPALPNKVLLDDLTRLELAYQHPGTGAWQDTWAAPRPPLRLRLLISTEADGAWPAIIVRLGQAG